MRKFIWTWRFVAATPGDWIRVVTYDRYAPSDRRLGSYAFDVDGWTEENAAWCAAKALALELARLPEARRQKIAEFALGLRVDMP